jgi:hypothetical protein
MEANNNQTGMILATCFPTLVGAEAISLSMREVKIRKWKPSILEMKLE